MPDLQDRSDQGQVMSFIFGLLAFFLVLALGITAVALQESFKELDAARTENANLNKRIVQLWDECTGQESRRP